jgi:hypothetical protein
VREGAEGAFQDDFIQLTQALPLIPALGCKAIIEIRPEMQPHWRGKTKLWSNTVTVLRAVCIQGLTRW